MRINARKWLIAGAIGILLFVQAAAGSALPFPDVPETSPFYDGIVYIWDRGMVKGYPDGKFHAENFLTRAEMATMFIRGENVKPKRPKKACFEDVPSSKWFSPFICTGKKLKFWSGYASGRFEPGWHVNRAEAIQMVCAIKKWNATPPESAPYEDAGAQQWYSACISYAKEHGFLDHLAQGAKLSPSKDITRGEFAQLYFFADNPSLGDTIVRGNFADLKKKMFALVNDERRKEGLNEVAWSQELSIPAEAHALDMVQNNFFDHVNPSGEDPDARRRKAGVATYVFENLSRGATRIEDSHAGLMESPKHRDNILTPDWERLGIGIAKNKKNQLFVAQWFSVFPVTEEEIEDKKKGIITRINSQRAQESLAPLVLDDKLSQFAAHWNRRMLKENFFGWEAPGDAEDAYFQEDLANFSDAQSVSMEIGKTESENFDSLEEQLLRGQSHLTSFMKKAGIGINMTEDGTIVGSLVLTE